MKQQLFFAHANGFPSKTYRKMFAFLEPKFDIGFIENIGLDPQYPAGNNWRHLSQQLEDYLRQHYQQPVIGLGHSLGGALHLITALRCPELYQQLIILDAPLYGASKSMMLKLAKRLDLMHKITPSKSSAKRRNHWDNAEQAFDYLRTKALYKHFDSDCLRDYIEFGMQHSDEGLRLLVPPVLEGKIFKHLPDNLALQKLQLPATFVYAQHSHVISAYDRSYLRRKFNLLEAPGGHLFPFEYPEKTADLVIEIAKQQTGEK